MLVQYSRPDEKGPKLSKFNVLDLDNSSGQLLEKMLNESNGTLGVLVKTRHLFMYQGRTRIHLDIVKNELDGSDFYGMEYEVCLNENEEPSEGEKVAKFLLNEFQIKDDQLCTKSYFEILNNQ
jgi:adenylate cyclase class IV